MHRHPRIRRRLQHVRPGDVFQGLGITAPSVTSVAVDGVSNSPGQGSRFRRGGGAGHRGGGRGGPRAPRSSSISRRSPSGAGWTRLAAAMTDSVNKPSVISISWGFAEGEPVQGFEWTQQTVAAVNETLQAAAAMGVTVLRRLRRRRLERQIERRARPRRLPGREPLRARMRRHEPEGRGQPDCDRGGVERRARLRRRRAASAT